jgi:hypothetical protein
MALCVHPGDEVYYKVTVGLGVFDCAITSGEVWIDLPDGRHIVLDDDLALLPDSSMTYDLSLLPDWENYVVNCDDPDSFSRCEALSIIPGGTSVPSAGEGTWTLYCLEPCIEVTKTPNMDVSKAGDTVIYTICVTNCTESADPSICDPTLFNVQVVDPLFGPGPLPGFSSELAAGDTVCLEFPYLVQPDDPDPLINVVTASGVDSMETQVDDSDEAEVDLVHPDFTIVKQCPSSASVGETIQYEITITNTGDVALDILSVVDSLVEPDPDGCVGAILAPSGGFCTDTYSYTVQPEDCPEFENTITVTVGIDQSVAALPNQLTRTDTCTTNCYEPDTTVDIKANDSDGPITVCEGDTVTLTICEQNTGDVDLTNPYVELYEGTTLIGTYDETSIEFVGVDGVDLGELDQGETWCWDVDVVAIDPTTTYNAIGYGHINGILVTWCETPTSPPADTICDQDELDEVTMNTEPCGGEGCTPGFWKNNAVNWDHIAWVGYTPNQKFSSIFGVPPITIFLGGNPKKSSSYKTDPTLLEALGANGGGINALARHAVAALLNTSSGCVQYAYEDVGDLIADVHDAIVAGAAAIQALHVELAGYNEAGCPVNQHGECVGVEDEI